MAEPGGASVVGKLYGGSSGKPRRCANCQPRVETMRDAPSQSRDFSRPHPLETAERPRLHRIEKDEESNSNGRAQQRGHDEHQERSTQHNTINPALYSPTCEAAHPSPVSSVSRGDPSPTKLGYNTTGINSLHGLFPIWPQSCFAGASQIWCGAKSARRAIRICFLFQILLRFVQFAFLAPCPRANSRPTGLAAPHAAVFVALGPQICA